MLSLLSSWCHLLFFLVMSLDAAVLYIRIAREKSLFRHNIIIPLQVFFLSFFLIVFRSFR